MYPRKLPGLKLSRRSESYHIDAQGCGNLTGCWPCATRTHAGAGWRRILLLSKWSGSCHMRTNPARAYLAVRAYVEANPGERAVKVRERAPDIVERLPSRSRWEDDVGLFVFRPDLLIGLPEGGVASCINDEQKQHQGRKPAHLIANPV